EYVCDPESTGCTRATGDRLLAEASAMWTGLSEDLVIGAYAGSRAKLVPPEVGGFSDFVFRRRGDQPGAVHLLGIESPGLTAAAAIARHVVDKILPLVMLLQPKALEAIALRRWPDRFADLPEEDKARRVREDADHGEIVCRCEGVTKAEILHAMANPLGVTTLSGIKLRTRATMGRCGGGYCLPRMVEILQRERGWGPKEFLLRGPASPVFAGRLLGERHVGSA
ncbi:MAG: (2Fe-2S)-binding protein, partial [Candidatus Bipolaricaulota bacterium]